MRLRRQECTGPGGCSANAPAVTRADRPQRSGDDRPEPVTRNDTPRKLAAIAGTADSPSRNAPPRRPERGARAVSRSTRFPSGGPRCPYAMKSFGKPRLRRGAPRRGGTARTGRRGGRRCSMAGRSWLFVACAAEAAVLSGTSGRGMERQPDAGDLARFRADHPEARIDAVGIPPTDAREAARQPRVPDRCGTRRACTRVVSPDIDAPRLLLRSPTAELDTTRRCDRAPRRHASVGGRRSFAQTPTALGHRPNVATGAFWRSRGPWRGERLPRAGDIFTAVGRKLVVALKRQASWRVVEWDPGPKRASSSSAICVGVGAPPSASKGALAA